MMRFKELLRSMWGQARYEALRDWSLDRLTELRMLNADKRRLPQFLIIGVHKGGTTSLFKYLAQHPYVRVPYLKEIGYFSLFHARGERWYRAHFPRQQQSGLTGEASTNYLCHPAAATRAHTLLPEAKIIVLLRDPIARAYSHYHYVARLYPQHAPKTFEAALDAEQRMFGAWDGNPRTLTQEMLRFYSYLWRGHYAEQLKRWLAYYPPDQVLLLESEAFFADPQNALKRTLNFLDLAPDGLSTINLKARNVGHYNSEMAPEMRKRVEAYFHPHNSELRDQLGVEMSWL